MIAKMIFVMHTYVQFYIIVLLGRVTPMQSVRVS